MDRPCSATAFMPTKSNTWSAPRGKKVRTASTGSFFVESMMSVAAKMLSRLQSGGPDVDDDYPRCAGDTRAAHGVKADAACAEDHDCVACLHVGGVDDRARARNDAAPEQHRLRERHVVWEEGKLVLVDECAF